jgi:hypothetical protein
VNVTSFRRNYVPLPQPEFVAPYKLDFPVQILNNFHKMGWSIIGIYWPGCSIWGDLLFDSLGNLITLPLSGISGIPSPITRDPGSCGGDGFALATPLVSPSLSSRLQEFTSSKGLRGGISVF